MAIANRSKFIIGSVYPGLPRYNIHGHMHVAVEVAAMDSTHTYL